MNLVQEKLHQAADILREFDVDCWITFVRESQLNGDPVLDFLLASDVTWHTALIVSREGKTWAIVGKYDQASVEDLGAYGEVIGYVESIRPHLQEVIRRLQPRQIAVNYSKDSEICDGITHGMFLTLQEMLEEIGYGDRIISAEAVVSALRQRKTEAELDAIRRAIRATEEIFDEVRQFIRPGRTEKEIAEFMKQRVKERGLELAWDPAYCPGVFTGPAEAEAHYHPTDRQVQPGHVLNMDFGVKVDGYCSDLQRTFYVLEPGEDGPPPEVRRGFETIVAAIRKAKDAIRPGAKGVDIDRIAREHVVTAGYPEYPHALGHQVGRFSHDGTALLGPAWEKYASKPFQPLEAGMVFTIEPRLPVEGRGVVTIEEMVVVTEQGAEWLSTPQEELILIR